MDVNLDVKVSCYYFHHNFLLKIFLLTDLLSVDGKKGIY